MSLPDGSTLGPYEVVSALGVGGMGEVYRARDTKLGREVALKVLPESVAADPDRLARFQREAQVLASLNHPNIAHVHGLEESGAVRALVMELVEGEDLAERLSRGPIPLDEALPIARQIAEAIEAAHEVGIVHRDLKPANIKVRADGMVKVLDFGLAKALDPASAGRAPTDVGRDFSPADPASNSPTITTPAMTRAGMILGTAAYMSPEQARGKPVDKRADIWAFGVVLYEMLTGARLFAGDTVSDVLAAVLTREPDLTALPASTPGPVRRLLRRCLERDPRQRLRDIGDARYDLGDGAQADAVAAPGASITRRTAALPWIVAAVGLVLAAVGFLRAPAGPVTTAPASRFTILPGLAGEIDGFPAISPDGRTIVFGVIPDDGVSHLWEFSFVTGESRLLPNTDYGTDPFWSPDGRSVAYFSRGQIRRIEMATGLSRALAPASDNRGGTWTEGGEIIFTPNSATGLFHVSAEGGEPAPLTTLDPSTEESHRYPTALPGGQAIIYSAVAADNSPQVGLFWRSLRDGTTRRLAPEVSRTAFDPRGFLLWMRQGGLVAQRLDPRAGALAGEPFPIAAQVGIDLQRNGKAWFDAGGGIVATRATTSQLSQLRWYDRGGKRMADVTSPGRFYEPALSPDGKSVAVSVGGADAPRGDIWVFDAGSKDRARRLTFGGVDTPMWSSDGRWVMFGRRGTGGSAITRRLADGSGAEETIYVHPHNAFVNTVSPRDPLAAFESYGGDGNEDLWLLPLDGDRKARPLLNSPAAEGHSAFSPDGRLLAYTSDESGLPQIYVREVGGAGNRWQLTTEGGDVAAWGSRGREIFYVGLDRVLRALPITQMAPFQFGEPVKLFRLEIPSLAISGNRTFYVPSPDGQRFLVNALVAPESEPGLRLVLNWHPPTGS